MKKLIALALVVLSLSACGPSKPNPADHYTGMAQIKELKPVAKSACIAVVRLNGNGKSGEVWVGRRTECYNNRFKVGQNIGLTNGKLNQ